MRNTIAWEHANYEDRMEVYQNYLRDFEKNHDFGFSDEPSSFEDFDAACRFSTFQHIRRLYENA